MGVPVARWGDEGTTGLPVDPLGIADGAIGVEVGAHQGVDPRLAIDDQIQGHRLMAVGRLGCPVRNDAVHRPEHMGDRAGAG